MVNLLLEEAYAANDPKLRHACSMAFDGTDFYLSDARLPVVYRVMRGAPMETIPTAAHYSALCYDHTEQCFWAVPEYSTRRIHKLSRDWDRIDTLELPGNRKQSISAVASDACTGKLLLFTTAKSFLFSQSGEIDGSCENPPGTLFSCGCCSENYRFICASGSDWPCQPVRILSRACTPLNMACLPEHLAARAFCPVYGRDGHPYLFVLAMKDYSHPRLLRYRVEKGARE